MSEQDGVGVIFDMDGVLVDSARAHFQSWRALATENGLVVTEEEFAVTFGRQNRDIIPKIFGPVDDQRLSDLGDRKESLYRELVRDNVPVVPGAVELVQNLSSKGVHLAIGSSGPLPNLELVLDAMGVRELVKVIVSADDVTRGKPDPQVFSMACSRLGLPPSRCVVVEDAPAGVEAARRAGTRVVAVLMHHQAEAFDNPDCIVDRLADLCADQLVQMVGN